MKTLDFYKKKLAETKAEIQLVEAQLQGKYNEELIQKRNNLYCDLEMCKSKIVWYGNDNRDKIQTPLDINIEILKP